MKMKKNQHNRREEGQSLLIIGSLLVVLLLLVGLVVDAGNAYAQNRILQNGVDAASMAGAQQLARQDDWKIDPDNADLYLYNFQVIKAVEDYARRNRANPELLSIYYADIDGEILADAKFELAREAIIDEYTFGETRAEAIVVEGDRNFPTYLVRLLGRTDMTAKAHAMAIVACGTCVAGDQVDGGLFPIAFHNEILENGNRDVPLGSEYKIFEKQTDFPGTGSFGWLSWNEEGGHTSNTTLAANMHDTSNSRARTVGDLIPTGPGVMNSNAVLEELRVRIDDTDPERPRVVTLPVFDYTEGNGENLKYHIVAFLNFQIDCYHFSKSKSYGSCTFPAKDNSKWIAGTIVPGVESTGTGGCTNYGTCAVIPTQLEVKRALRGRVVPWRTFVQQDATPGDLQPVDVVHVLDISGSMCQDWDGDGGGAPCDDQGRIKIAKDVLIGFNEGLSGLDGEGPVLGHRIGLATYPSKVSTSDYNTECYVALGSQCQPGPQADCGKSYNKLSFANLESDVTADIEPVNAKIDGLTADGGTSMAAGMQFGNQLIDEATEPNPVQVIILTTDGMPNMKIDGRWSGYLGNYTRPPLIVSSGCNETVYQDVIHQANLAKQEGTVIFTIGIHESIDEALMEAVASPDTHPDRPHSFVAQTGEEFAEIYNSIEERLPRLGTEECIANENAAIGDGAWVKLWDGNTLVESIQASSTGDFVFDDVAPGTYQLTASWIDNSTGAEYAIMTDILGGDPAEAPIEVTVPLGKQTTSRDLYLRTDAEFTCGE